MTTATANKSSVFTGMFPTGENAKKIVAAVNERNAAKRDIVPAAFFPYAAIVKKEESQERVVSSEFYNMKSNGIEAPMVHVFVPGII